MEQTKLNRPQKQQSIGISVASNYPSNNVTSEEFTGIGRTHQAKEPYMQKYILAITPYLYKLEVLKSIIVPFTNIHWKTA